MMPRLWVSATLEILLSSRVFPCTSFLIYRIQNSRCFFPKVRDERRGIQHWGRGEMRGDITRCRIHAFRASSLASSDLEKPKHDFCVI